MEGQGGEGGGAGEVSLNLVRILDVDKPEGYRPEIASSSDRVFVVYAYSPTKTGRDVKVKIFNKDMSGEIATKMIVSHNISGGPTDIRIAGDGDHLYAFYEVGSREAGVSSLYGAKYSLDDRFERLAYTGAIATGPAYKLQQTGDERKDDPRRPPSMKTGIITWCSEQPLEAAQYQRLTGSALLIC